MSDLQFQLSSLSLDATTPEMNTLALTDDVLTVILIQLSIRGIAQCAATCRQLKNCCYSEERMWQPLTKSRFGQLTTLTSWLHPSAAAVDIRGGHESQITRPTNFRQLYSCLNSYSKFIGLFEAMDKGSPCGALYSVHWQPDCIQLTQVVMCIHSLKQVPVIKLGPSHPHAAAQLLDSDKIVVTQTKATRGYSAAALAVAATAGAHHPGLHEDALGCSPPTSFGFEMLHFMAAAIKGGGGSGGNRRNSNRRPGSGGSSPSGPSGMWRDEVKLCLSRVSPQASSRQHPLAGLWKGVYSGHGMEVLSLRYDFSGSVARIIATKITGDTNVPAGQVSWSCTAAALPLPWPHEDTAIIEQQQSDALEEIEDLLFEGENDSEAAKLREERREGNVVVGLHHGSVQIAGPGFTGASFVAGRIWVLQNGGLSVVMPAFPHVHLTFSRLDVFSG